MELNELRKEINMVDDLILLLFRERMRISREIGTYKKANGLPILQPDREKELLDRMCKKAGPQLAPYTRRLFSTLMELSKEYQREVTP